MSERVYRKCSRHTPLLTPCCPCCPCGVQINAWFIANRNPQTGQRGLGAHAGVCRCLACVSGRSKHAPRTQHEPSAAWPLPATYKQRPASIVLLSCTPATDAHRSTLSHRLCLPHRGVPRPALRVSWRQQGHPEPAPAHSGGAHRQPRCRDSRSRGQGRCQGRGQGCCRQGRQPASVCCCCCCWGEARHCKERWVAVACRALRSSSCALGFSQMLALSAAKCQICSRHCTML